MYDVYIENNIEKEIQEWVNSLNLQYNNNYNTARRYESEVPVTFILFDKKTELVYSR